MGNKLCRPKPPNIQFTSPSSIRGGATENARHEFAAPVFHGLKLQDMKMQDQFAGVENAEKVSMESQSVKKWLKVVVFVCRVIPSV